MISGGRRCALQFLFKAHSLRTLAPACRADHHPDRLTLEHARKFPLEERPEQRYGPGLPLFDGCGRFETQTPPRLDDAAGLIAQIQVVSEYVPAALPLDRHNRAWAASGAQDVDSF